MNTEASALNAESFRTAHFATKRGLYTACRSLSGFWRTESGEVKSDQGMAAEGWSPVDRPSIEANALRKAAEQVAAPVNRRLLPTPNSVADFLRRSAIRLERESLNPEAS